MSEHGHGNGHDDVGKDVIETLLEATRIVSGGLDLRRTLDLLLEQLGRLVDFDSASILTRRGDSFTIVAGRGYPVTEEVIGHTFNPAENPVVRDVLASRLPIILPDVTKHTGWQTLESTRYIRSWMGIPLLYKDELVGLLSIDKGLPYFFTERMAKLVRTFANHVAVAIAMERMSCSKPALAKEETTPLMPRSVISIEEPQAAHEAAAASKTREASGTDNKGEISAPVGRKEVAAVAVQPIGVSTVADAVKTGPELPKLSRRETAYEREIRASRRRLLIGAAIGVCGLVGLIWTIIALGRPDKDTRHKVRSAEEVHGYVVPVAATAPSQGPLKQPVEAVRPAEAAPALPPLEEARRALAESVSRRRREPVAMVVQPFSDAGQQAFLVEGRLPFTVASQGTAFLLFNGKEVGGVSSPVRTGPSEFSAVIGPINVAKKVAGGIYTVQVNLLLDLGGDPSGTMAYMPAGPGSAHPPLLSFPLRFSFYQPGVGESRQEKEAAAAFLLDLVKNVNDVVATMSASYKSVEKEESTEAAWLRWEKKYTAAVARVHKLRSELAAFDSAYLACPYGEAVSAVNALFETAMACLAEMNARLAQKAGVVPEQGGPAVGATVSVALAPDASEERDFAALVAAAASESENVISRTLAAEYHSVAHATGFLVALKQAALSACTEVISAERWLRAEAPRQKSQYAQLLGVVEKYIAIWRCKVQSLLSFDPAMVKLTEKETGGETLRRLTELLQELLEAGTGALIDTLYDLGFVPSADIAAFVKPASDERDTSHLDQVEEILQDLEAVRITE